MTIHEIIRTIDGTRYRCQDIGCPDFDRAAYNRLLVTKKWFTTAYLEAENWLIHAPPRLPLPSWLPTGELPVASGKLEFWGMAKREQEESAAEFLDLKAKGKEVGGEEASILANLS